MRADARPRRLGDAMGKPVNITKYEINDDASGHVIDGSTLSTSIQQRGLLIHGNGGNDTIRGGSGADLLYGDDGNDLVYGEVADLAGAGGAGKVVWDGGKGIDTLDVSGIQSDPGKGVYLVVLDYSPKGDTTRILTNMEKDDGSTFGPTSWEGDYSKNFTNFENFTLGSGNDWVYLSSNALDNVVHGGGGDDLVNAGAGNDTVYGDDGNDIVDGGWGNDNIYGGAGSDAFSWQGRLVGQYTVDVVKDFDIDNSDGTHDQVWLFGSWFIQWDANSSVLHGYLVDPAYNNAVFGEVTFEGLTYADHGSVEVHNIDPNTGFPVG
jgi:Ca2+-binding RTX toxin-like protein